MRLLNIDNISALNQSTIVTIGMFDGVHIGHRHLLQLLLQQAREQCLLPVVVTFDQHPRYVLGADVSRLRLLSTYQERLDLLESCGIRQVAVVHFTKELATLSACQFVEQYLLPRLNMKSLVLGYDNVFGNKNANDFGLLPRLAQENGFNIINDTAVYVDGVDVSSTKIRNALLQGDVTFATRMLGVPYGVIGKVVHGRQVGRTLGFPTANIALNDPLKVVPKEGVYAVRVLDRASENTSVMNKCLGIQAEAFEPQQSSWLGMASLGPQPTFGEEGVTLEVNLFDCQENLYDKDLQVSFMSYLRDIKRFDTPEELARQLETDKKTVLTSSKI